MIVAGNLLYDGSHYYFYDAENHLIQVDGTLGYCTAGTGTAATACYVYDAEGHRVHRTGVITDTCDGTGKRDYVFDLAGNWVGEYSSNGNGCKSEIYAGSRHLVTYAGGTPLFIHSDWLGTVRLRNNATYPTYNFQTCTSLPFGDALTCGREPKHPPLHRQRTRRRIRPRQLRRPLRLLLHGPLHVPRPDQSDGAPLSESFKHT
jgi:hypothetical protein